MLQVRTAHNIEDKDGITGREGAKALILEDQEKPDEAMELHKEKERICRELGNKGDLAISLINQADLIAQKMGKPKDGLPLAGEAYNLTI